MPTEPAVKRAVVFIDGQNLFWIKTDNATYAACLDARDDRPKGKAK